MRKTFWVAFSADVSTPVSRLLALFVGVFRGKSDIKALPPPGSPTAAGANALTRQVIRNFVEFAVDVANKPFAVRGTEAFAQIVAFVEKFADVSTVTAPPACHQRDNQHRIPLKDDERKGVANRPPQALAEAKKLCNVVGRRVGAELGGRECIFTKHISVKK